MWKAIITVFAVLAALAIAGVAQPSPSSAQYGAEEQLFGGGRFVFDFDSGPAELILPRDFSISAAGMGARSEGTMYYGHPDRPTPSPANPISCLEVEGNRAVVGGVFADGTRWVRYFDDEGPVGPAPADQVTPVFNMTDAEVARFMPKRFPDDCPSVTPPTEWGTVWAPLDTGDIAVVDGGP